MKKLYIYLFIGFISFFVFTNSASATCVYKGTVDDNNTLVQLDKNFNVTVNYNKSGLLGTSKLYPYSLQVSNYNYSDIAKTNGESVVSFHFSEKTDKNNVAANDGGRILALFSMKYKVLVFYSLGDTNGTCPNLTMTYDLGSYCFDTGNECDDYYNKTSKYKNGQAYNSSRGEGDQRNYIKHFKISGVAETDYSSLGLTEDKYCVFNHKVDNKYCHIKFEYKASDNSLSMYALPDSSSSIPSSWNNAYEINSNTFNCADKQFNVGNMGLGINQDSSDVVVGNIYEFKEKVASYLKDSEVNGGECDFFKIHTEDKYETFVLDDAKEACLDGNCDGANKLTLAEMKLSTIPVDWNGWYQVENISSCYDLLGQDIIDFINDILLYVKILIPILLIGFGVADFVRAMISTDEQAMKKAQKKFFKRLIIAGVIFLIPSLTNLIFNVVNGVWTNINSDACNAFIFGK